MSIRVERCLGGRDLRGLGTLCAAHAAYEDLAFEPADFEARLAPWLEGPAPRVFLWMARDGAEAVGYAAASTEFSTLAAARYLHLDCLFVVEAVRSRGTGAALMGAAAAQAQRLDLPRIEWQTPAWNAGAVRFYERLGATALPKLRFSATAETLRR